MSPGQSNRAIEQIIFVGEIMRLILFALLVLAAGASNLAAQYSMTHVSDGGGRLRFLSASEAFAIGANTITHTLDSGVTWITTTASIQAATQCQGVFDGTFVNSRTGWLITHQWPVSTDSSFIYKTTDGGANWVRQRSSPIAAEQYASHRYSHIHFADEDNGWVIGKGIIEHTTDGGQTWTTQLLWKEQQSNNDWLNCSFFRNEREGWVGGYGSFILHTTDAGQTWTTQHVDSTTSGGIILHVDRYYLRSIHFADGMNGFAATNNGNFLVTRDGGATWLPGATGFPNDNVRVLMMSDQIVWQVGGDYCDEHGCFSGQSVLYSSDAGITWKSLQDTTLGYIGSNSQFLDIHFINRSLGYAANERGQIFRIVDTSSNVSVAAVEPEEAASLAVFPNPADDFLKIDLRASIPAGQVTLFSPSGRIVYSNGIGTSDGIVVNTSALDNGIYLLEVGVGAARVKRKIAIVHQGRPE